MKIPPTSGRKSARWASMSPSGIAHKAGGVAVIDHHQRIELVSEVADPLQIRDIAIHGKHAIGRDELDLAPGVPGGFQLRVRAVYLRHPVYP